MRKIIVAALFVVAIAIFAPIALQANEITVTIDGVTVDFEGQPPVIVDGRTLVPVRGVFEALGFEVAWNQDLGIATLINPDFVVIVTIGSDFFRANGREIPLDVPAQIIAGRTMLPIRAVVESVGYNVDWDQSTNTVIITGTYTQAAGQETGTFAGFDFALPQSITLNPDLHSPDNFTRNYVQGLLPDFIHICFEGGSVGGSVIEAFEHGVVGVAIPVDPEIFLEDFGGLDTVMVLELMFGRINLDGLYILRPFATVDVSIRATSAILNIPVWDAAEDRFMSLFYLGQELPNGDMYGVILFVSLNDLDEIGYGILSDYSARAGYDFLASAVNNMESALRLIEMFAGSD